MINVMDRVLDGDEDTVQELVDDMGPIYADKYVEQHNNHCVMMSGFEPKLMSMIDRSSHFFYAPFESQSIATH